MTKTLTEQWREGNRFGKLTVLGFHHKDKHYHRYYECVCDCGNESVVRGDVLQRGTTESCGCGKGLKHGYHKRLCLKYCYHQLLKFSYRNSKNS